MNSILKATASERFWMWAARHIPRKLAYWSFIQQGVDHIHPGEIVPDVPYTTVLERLSK